MAYSKDEGVTTSILLSKGPFKLKVDQNGKARLSSKAGIVTFSGTPTLDKIGANIKSLSVSFSPGEGKQIKYHASFDLKVSKVAVRGSFDVEQVIMSCSGLLCRAARAMKGRHEAYDRELKRVMGR